METKIRDGRPWYAIPRRPLKRPPVKIVILASLVSGVLFGIGQRWNGGATWSISFVSMLIWILGFNALAVLITRGLARRIRE